MEFNSYDEMINKLKGNRSLIS